MRNQTTTTEQFTMQVTLPLEDVEEKVIPERNLAPTFKLYDNKQAQMILDLELFIPDHHVARVPYHPKMMLKVILYGYSQRFTLAEASKGYCKRTFRPCGCPRCNSPTSVPRTTSVACA